MDIKQNIRPIPLSQGKFAIVDADDYIFLNQWKWFCNPKGYAVRNIPVAPYKQTVEFMHRVIMNPPNDMYIDHINGDKIDNRRCNLRICTNNQNQWNRGKTKGKSKYKGVYWLEKNKKWAAQITVYREQKYLGIFTNEEDAALVWNEAAIKYHGEFAKLNLIRKD